MKEIFNEHREKLEISIAANEKEENPLKRASLNLRSTKETIYELQNFLAYRDNEDRDVTIDIEYNRHLLPPLYAKVLLYSKCYEVENSKLHLADESRRAYLKQELEKIHQFFIDQKKFCQYYYTARSECDAELFTSENVQDYPILRDLSLPFCVNPGCMLAACLLANEQYGDYLQRELGEVSGSILLNTAIRDKDIKFNGTETDMVELILAANAAEVFQFKGKNATQEVLIQCAQDIFGLSLKNWEQLAKNIKNRKITDQKMLKRLSDGLSVRNGKLPPDQFRQKRLTSNRIK